MQVLTRGKRKQRRHTFGDDEFFAPVDLADTVAISCLYYSWAHGEFLRKETRTSDECDVIPSRMECDR